jgi:hypothetical protein
MTEQEWLTCTNADPMIGFLFCSQDRKGSDRKELLFGCACARRVWDLLTDERSRTAVEVAERLADGLGSDKEVEAACDGVKAAIITAIKDHGQGSLEAWAACVLTHAFGPPYMVSYQAIVLIDALAYWSGQEECRESDREEESAAQADLLRELFGNPFRPVTIAPATLAWNSETIPKLAQDIYGSRAFDRLPILADALEEAGCTDADILGHCRLPGEHVPGCWVVDAILSKG